MLLTLEQPTYDLDRCQHYAFVCGNPTCQPVALLGSPVCCCCCTYHHHVICTTPPVALLTVGNHGKLTVTHQLLPHVTAADGESVFACECVRVRAMFRVGTKTYSEERSNYAAKGAGRYKHTHRYMRGGSTTVQHHHPFKLWPSWQPRRAYVLYKCVLCF